MPPVKWLIHNLQIVTKPTDHFSRPYRSDGANYYPRIYPIFSIVKTRDTMCWLL